MTESELRAVLLLRAFERAPLGWSVNDGQWAGQEARRRLGEQASAEAWLVQRARLGLARLIETGVLAAPLAAGAPGLRRGLAALVLAAAALLGGLGDVLGGGQVINLLAPPLLVLLVWNLGTYGVLLGFALRRLGRASMAMRRGGAAFSPSPATQGLGPLRRAVLQLWQRGTAWTARVAARAQPAGASAGVFAGASEARQGAGHTAAGALWLQFGQDWLLASAPLQAARLATLLHAAAAFLALGALASLYARGLVLDYRAGWDSTFLGASAVQHVLTVVLGPAATLSGLALPDVGGVAGLRLASGGGEGAARWIHLWALTLLLAVVLPRALLAALALVRAAALAARLPLPARFDDLQRLLRSTSDQPLPVVVLAYSYTLGAPHLAQLQRVLVDAFGPGVPLRFQSLPMGAEDDLPRWLAAAAGPIDAAAAAAAEADAVPPGTVLALFALTATPEHETHGALLRALAAELPAGAPLGVMVDESGFRARFVGREGAERLTQRRSAWSALLRANDQTARFIDLSDGGAIPGGAPGGANTKSPGQVSGARAGAPASPLLLPSPSPSPSPSPRAAP